MTKYDFTGRALLASAAAAAKEAAAPPRLTDKQMQRYADDMLAEIAMMQDGGTLPDTVPGFAFLHDYFDANVGWGDEIDNLPHDQWAALADAVDARLRAAFIRGICAREFDMDADYPYFSEDYRPGESADAALVRMFYAERPNHDTDEATVLVMCHG